MKILVLTGAGLSAESGISTFRDEGGLWQGHKVEEVATPDAFARNPGLVLDFYNDRREAIKEADPNSAHTALAKLQRNERHKTIIITQNVDDLLERAGCTRVVHMHGSVFRARCNACGQSWPASYDMEPEDPCPFCNEMSVRPDVVWFGEAPKQMALIQQAIKKAELFVAIGTSCSVYPAADLVQIATANGAQTLEMNLTTTSASQSFHECVLGPASQTVPKWVRNLTGEEALF